MQTLSPFQKRLCKLRAQGLTNREIGEILKKAEKTIRNHFVEIRKALSIPDRDMALFVQAAEPEALTRKVMFDTRPYNA